MKISKESNLGMNRRLAAYSAAAGTACAITSVASADPVVYDNGGAGWTATINDTNANDYYLTFGLGGVVNLPDDAGDPVTDTNGAQFALDLSSISSDWGIENFDSTTNTIGKVGASAPTSVADSDMKKTSNQNVGSGTSYAPLDFVDGTGNHYGWAEITFADSDSATLNEFTYETTPDTAYAAPTPEPSTAALITVTALAGGLVGLRRRRQARQSVI